MKPGRYTENDLSLYSISRDVMEDGLLFFCHCVNGYSFASHLDYDTGLYKFDDGQCDFYANGFDCQDCSNHKCIYRKNLH